jgi:hypothetical protein
MRSIWLAHGKAPAVVARITLLHPFVQTMPVGARAMFETHRMRVPEKRARAHSTVHVASVANAADWTTHELFRACYFTSVLKNTCSRFTSAEEKICISIRDGVDTHAGSVCGAVFVRHLGKCCVSSARRSARQHRCQACNIMKSTECQHGAAGAHTDSTPYRFCGELDASWSAGSRLSGRHPGRQA